MPKPKKSKDKRTHLGRRINQRELRQRFLIVCEGRQTEPNYFKAFRTPTTLKIIGVGKNPSQIVQEALNRKDDEEFDQIWCVFDKNSFTSQDFNEAINSAEHNGIGVAYSNQSFELWYLLHFDFHHAAVDRKGYEKKLTAKLSQPYEKNSKEMFSILLGRRQQAIENAEKLRDWHSSNSPAQCDPSTTVDLLVKELMKYEV